MGSGRSGTDVVVASIGASLDVLIVNEDNPEAFENWRLRDLDEVQRVIDEALAPVLLFKPIVETYRIRELLDRFPESKAIFVARNPHDSVNSMVRFFGSRTAEVVDGWMRSGFRGMTWSVPPEVTAAARELHREGEALADAPGVYWFVYNSAFEALDLVGEPRVLLTLYEDFVEDPDGEIRRACRHLRVPFRSAMSAGVYRSSVGKHTPPPMGPATEKACERVWRGLRAHRAETAA